MLEAHGLLQLTMRSESYRREAQILIQNNSRHATKNDSGSSGGNAASSSPSLNAKSAITLPKGALDGPMKEFWQKAADKAAERAPSADTVKKLQDAAKSDNKEIAAQKMQQAKAKLQSLRLQAQLAAASGDKQQLRRLAQEVAAAAREVASAAHDLGAGIVDSVGGDSGSTPQATAGDAAGSANSENSPAAKDGAEPTTPEAAAAPGQATGESPATAVVPRQPGEAPATDDQTNNDADKTAVHDDPLGSALNAKPKDEPNTPIYAQDPPEDGDKRAWAAKALNSLSTDANNALAQARGLLAFIASLARGKRKQGETGDDDAQFYNDLQRVVDEAQAQVNHDLSVDGQALAAQQIDAGQTADVTAGAGAGSDSVLGIETITVTQVTTTAVFLDITT